MAEPQPRRASRSRWIERRRRSRGTLPEDTGPDESADDPFSRELREALPPGLVAALPQVPVATLFVTVSLAKAGRTSRDLTRMFTLTLREANTVVAYATSVQGDPVEPAVGGGADAGSEV